MAAPAPQNEEPDYPLPTALEIHDARSLRWQRRWDERRARLITQSTTWLDAKRIEWASQPADVLSRSYIRGLRPDGYGTELDDALFLLRPSDEAPWPGVLCRVCMLLLAEPVPNGPIYRMPCAPDKAHMFHRDCVVNATKGATVACPWDQGCGNVYEHLETFPYEEKVDLHNVERKFSSAAPSSSMTGGYDSPWLPGSEKGPKKPGSGSGGGGNGGTGDDGGGPQPSDSDSDSDRGPRSPTVDSDADDPNDTPAHRKKKKANRKKKDPKKKNAKMTKAQWEAAKKRAARKVRNRKKRHARQAELDEEEEERRKPKLQFFNEGLQWVTRRTFYDFDYLPREYTGRDRRADNRFRPEEGKGWHYRKIICGGGPGSNFRVVAADDILWIQDRIADPGEWSREYDTLSEGEWTEDSDGEKTPRNPVEKKKQSKKKKGKALKARKKKKKAARDAMRELNRQKAAGTLSPKDAGWGGAGPWSSDSDWSEPASP